MQNQRQQVRPWGEVTSSEQFQALSPEHQERARELYYQDNVAPRVPQGMEQRAREMFDQDTAASSAMGMQIPDRQGGIEVMDYVKEAGAGVLTGTGAMISGVGDAVRHDPMGRQPVETPKGDFMPLTSRIGNALDPITRPVTDAIDGPARAVGGWISGKGQELSDSKTEAAKQALQASTPAGDITSPTTWSMGEDPSIAGYGLHAANLAGQFAPQAGAIAATRGRSIQTPVMMGVGGLQAGGSAADEVEERITAAADVELQESSTLYKQLRESMSEPDARQTLVAKARNAAFGGAAPIGAFGGLATQAVFGPVQRAIGGTVGRRLAGSIAVDAPLEGVQEVLESTESRRATNKALGEQQSLTEDTFGDFALGAMGGAGQASAGTAVSVASGKSGLSGTAPAGTVDQNDPFHIPDDPDAPGAAQQYAVDSLDPSNAQYQDNRQRPDLQQAGLRMPGDQTVQQQTDIASNEDPSRTVHPSKQIAPPMGLEFNEVQQAPKPAAQKLPQDQAKYSWDSMNTFERNKAAQDTLGYAGADMTEAAAKAWDQLVPQDQQKLADAMAQDSGQRWDTPNQKISDKDRPVLQNRDRTTTASIAQMQDIRNNPDYTRLSFSRDFGNGAPVIEPGAEFPTAQLGLTERAVTSVGRKIPVQYAAIEADQLLPSNDALGNSIPEYATGVEGKSRAIAGNGRIAGIAAAWKSGKAKAYKQEMIKDGQHGIDPEVIRAMKQPVLVRIMPLSEVSNNIGDESNVSGQAGLSPTEQANTDMRRIDLAELSLTEDNELSENTVLDFIKGMPKSELGTLLTKSGRPTAEAFARAEVALFQQAYQNETLTENLVDLKGDAKFIMNALMRAAPAMAKLEGAGIYDIRPLVSEAAEVAVNARRQGIKLSEFIKMGDFGRNPKVMPILEMMVQSGQRTTAIGDKLINLAQMAYTEANKAGQDMFGEVVKQSPEALMKKAFDGEKANAQEIDGTPEALGNDGRPRPDASNAEGRAIDGEGQPDSGEIQADQRGAKSEAAEAGLKKKAAEKKASTEPTTEKWRKNYLLAKKRATELGIDPKEHGKLPGLVKAIDAVIAKDGPATRYDLKDKSKPQADAAAIKADSVAEALASTPELAGVKVVQSFEDLPAAVRKRIAADGIKPSDLSGVYMNGSTYVVADSHATVADAVRTAVHEEVGHLGIRGLLGDKLTPTMERIYSSMAATAAGRKLIAGIRSNYASAAEGMSTKEQHQMIAEELVAHLLETGDKPTLVQRFVSKIRELLRAMFPQVKWTDSDVLALGEHSRKWLRTKNGENVPGMRYSLKEDGQQRNSDLFDDNDGYKREARPVQGRLDTGTQQDGGSIDLPDETAFRKHQRRWQDNLNRFTVIREWLADRGVELGENADVYLAEERMHSRFTNKTTDFREGTVKPLVKKIQKAGYTMEDVSQFLHAQHAQERNAQIAKINRNMPDGGSGMSNADARAIIASADQKLIRVANELRAITDSTRKVLIDSGLISQEQADAWQKSYQYYVPLKGGPDDNASKAGTGKGLKTEHKIKRALGHDVREEGEWIIENILADHERALLSAEKNTVGKHLLKMAMDIGIDSIMTVGKPEKRGVLRNQVSYEVLYKGRPVGAFDTLEGAKVFKMSAPLTIGKAASPADITIRKTSDPSVVYMASPMPALNEAMVYIKGDIIRVQINDELLARAYGNMGADALGTLLRSAQALNRWFSSVYTGYSPEFLIVNVTRDFTTGLANITGEEGALFATKAVKNYFSSFGDLLKYAHKGVDNKWIRMYREDGGNTGAAYLSDLERLGTDMQTEYAVYQGVLANLRKGETRVAVRAAMRKAFNATLRHVEALNEAGENSMRLALYRTAVEQGMSRNKAASMSKNTTVNFNRKGEMGAQFNALFLFFNATVQGTASVAHAHVKGKHKKQAWALSGAMAALSYSLSLLSAGSDEEEYEKTPEYAKERNIVIPLGNGEAVTIPVPYGYGFFFTFGRLMADIQRTGDTDGAAWKLASAFTGEFLPFGGTMAGDEPDMVQAGTYMWPTIAQIPLSVANNRTSFGSPMRPENSNKRFEPDRLKMWRGTEGTWADALAGALEGVGADVSPETLKHMSRTFGGGAGTFTGSVVDAIALGAQGAKPEIREIPIVRKFYRVNSVSDARSRFWRYQGETRKATEEFQRVIDSGDRGAVQEFVQSNRELIALGDVAKAFSEAASATRDRVQEIRLGDLPIAKKREQIKKLEEKEAELYDRFVRIFKDKKG